MYILNHLKNNILHLLYNQINEQMWWGGSSSWNNTEQQEVKEPLPNLETQKEYIKDILSNEKVVSLDDNPKLKQKILDGLENNSLSKEQINTIYKELKNIQNVENKILTPDVIEKIKQESVNYKFDKLSAKIKSIQAIASNKQKEDILAAETSLCEALWICEWVEEAKKAVQESSIKERKEVSNEKLSTITNKEFLKLPPEKRLIHITKNNISSEKVASWNEKKLEFTFTFDWKFNRELYLKTTAGQVLPNEVREVESNWIKYQRTWLKWEFFASWWRRLTIHEWTKIDDIKIWTPEEMKKN
jgi:hypothetical protein